MFTTVWVVILESEPVGGGYSFPWITGWLPSPNSSNTKTGQGCVRKLSCPNMTLARLIYVSINFGGDDCLSWSTSDVINVRFCQSLRIFHNPSLKLIDIIPLGKLAKKADISFRSDLRLPSLQLPTLILHAEDDTTIPYQQGRNLYGTAVKAGKRDIRMVCFAYDLGCEHSFISKSRQLPALIRKFYNGQMRGPMLSRVTGKENMCMRTSRECTSPRKQWHGFDTACKLWWISSWHKPTKYQPMHYA